MEVVKILIAAGADADKLDNFGYNPLSLAAGSGREDIVALLLPSTKDINAQDQRGNTALSFAAFGQHERVVRMLLTAGAQIAPQEPGPHSRLILESERMSGYGKDALLAVRLDEGPGKPSGVVNDILGSLLEAAIAGECNPGLDIATVTAERLTKLLQTKVTTRAASTSEQSLEIVHEEELKGWEKWILARAASANRDEVARLRDLVRERTVKRFREMGEIWDATLPVERVEKLKHEVDWDLLSSLEV